ncbi:MAG: hypothetical protein OHK0013_14710 [Sandaracinaceae bacterium]
MRSSAALLLVTLAGVGVAGCGEDAPPLPDGRRDAGPCSLRPERCDGRDNDCNGVVDDTGLSELCDGSDQDCDGTVDEGAGCETFDAPGPDGWTLTPRSSGVFVDEDGLLVLEPPRVDLVQPAVWIANTNEGTVSRLDAATGREVARYTSVDDTSGLLPGGGNLPSRTALDQRLDAYVANRAFDGQASVTKIAGDRARCIDRDLDGVIETSEDLDGDGTISLVPELGEHVGPADECLLWTQPVGSTNAIARALAIGLVGPDGEPGDVWVGLFNERRVLVLSREDGHEVASVPVPIPPYGAVAGVDGTVWLTSGPSPSGVIVGIDPESLEVERVPLPEGMTTYGITVDGLGRVLLAATRRSGPAAFFGVIAYDPRTDAWSISERLPGSGTTSVPMRGVAASADRVLVSGRGDRDESVVHVLRTTDLALVETHAFGAREIVGVGVGFDGAYWAIDQHASRAYRRTEGGAWIGHPVGAGPYTYSDFTGFGLNGVLGTVGLHRITIEGCEGAVWTALLLDGDLPVETSVSLRVRTASAREELAAAAWIGPFEPPSASLVAPPGPVPAGRFLEVSLRLSSTTPGVVPRVRSVTASARCDDVL